MPAQRLQTGTILVQETENELPTSSGNEVTVYARVSSHDQKKDLARQVSRLCQYATAQGYVVSEIVTEVGSGMSTHRKKLTRCLANQSVKFILIEHRERLTRFGFEWIELLMKSSGRQILVMEDNELSEQSSDLFRDMIDILTSFCARLYGKKSASHRAKQAIQAIQREDGSHVTSKNS